MLLLERKIGEEIIIGDNIVIQVVEVRSGPTVRLGVTAPKEITVNRREIQKNPPESKRKYDK